MSMNGTIGMGGSLSTRRIRPPQPSRVHSFRTPFGRLLLTRDRGDALISGRDAIMTNLQAVHRRGDGRVKDVYDLGSGLITNAGVAMMAWDFTPWTAGATLKQQNFHGLGTGATAAALSDVVIQTQVVAGALTGSTNGFMTATQSFILPTTATPHPIYQTTATFTALAASTAVTEWGLFMSNIAPLNIPGSGTTYSATGAAFSAITAPLVGGSVLNVATAVNTTTSTLLGLVTASSTTTLTVPGWNTMLHATGSTPAGASASQVVPTMWDHKVFGAITLVTSDTLAVTYQAQITSGG